MRGLDRFALCEISDSSGELNGAVVAAGGELHRARGGKERFFGLLAQLRERFDLLRPHIGVVEISCAPLNRSSCRVRAAAMRSLTALVSSLPRGNRKESVSGWHLADVHPHIDAIGDRA